MYQASGVLVCKFQSLLPHGHTYSPPPDFVWLWVWVLVYLVCWWSCLPSLCAAAAVSAVTDAHHTSSHTQSRDDTCTILVFLYPHKLLVFTIESYFVRHHANFIMRVLQSRICDCRVEATCMGVTVPNHACLMWCLSTIPHDYVCSYLQTIV